MCRPGPHQAQGRLPSCLIANSVIEPVCPEKDRRGARYLEALPAPGLCVADVRF